MKCNSTINNRDVYKVEFRERSSKNRIIIAADIDDFIDAVRIATNLHHHSNIPHSIYVIKNLNVEVAFFRD